MIKGEQTWLSEQQVAPEQTARLLACSLVDDAAAASAAAAKMAAETGRHIEGCKRAGANEELVASVSLGDVLLRAG